MSSDGKLQENKEGTIKSVEMRMGMLVVILFATVCEGCFGMEEMVGVSGPGMTLMMILLVPIFWALPISLVCAELGAAFPVQGGTYIWVKKALGPFWGYQAAYWRTWIWYLNAGVLLVLAMSYVKTWFGFETFSIPYAACIGLICLFIGYVNLKGIKMVGWVSVAFTICIMLPFGLLVIFGLFNWQYNPAPVFLNPNEPTSSSVAFAIILGVWMYGAYEAPGGYAGEIKNFKKIFPKALLITVLAMTLTYFLPVLSGLASVGNWETWGTENGIDMVVLCQRVGGDFLGWMMLISAMLSNVIMVNDNVAATTRVTYALAKDKLLPKFFATLTKKHGIPTWGTVFMMVLSVIVTFSGSFEILIEFQTFVFFSTYIMLIVAGIALRIKQPNLPRPFKIPLGTVGLILYSIPVLGICVYSILFSGPAALIGALIFGLSGPLTYVIFKKIYGGVKKGEGVGYEISADPDTEITPE